MTSHNLEDEAPLVTVGSSHNGVDGLHDPVEGRVGADGHVSAAEVVINWANHPNDVQVRELYLLVFRDIAW